MTEQPKVVFAPGGGYVVLFGTGKFVENADAAAGNFKNAVVLRNLRHDLQ
ncbi:hypothetical protein ACFS07_25070 [Undibacterium arcticum]